MFKLNFFSQINVLSRILFVLNCCVISNHVVYLQFYVLFNRLRLVFLLGLIFTLYKERLFYSIFIEIFLSSGETSFKWLNRITLLQRLIQMNRHFVKWGLFEWSPFAALNRILIIFGNRRNKLNTLYSVIGKLRDFISREWINNLYKIVKSECFCLIYTNFWAFLYFTIFEHLIHIVGVERSFSFVQVPRFLIRWNLVFWYRKWISYLRKVDFSISQSRIVSKKTLVWNYFLVRNLIWSLRKIIFVF